MAGIPATGPQHTAEMPVSESSDWQHDFDNRTYLEVFYGRDLFHTEGRFLADRMKAVCRTWHDILTDSE